MEKQYIHIETIIELIKKQHPERLEVIDQLRKLGKSKIELKRYVRFVNSNKPNQKESEWEFQENLSLKHETEGTIVLDLLKDSRIGGIEFMNQIPY